MGCNVNPDPSGGHWTDPPLGDEWWYPLYEKLVELDVTAMMHASATCNPAFHTTGSHYLNVDARRSCSCWSPACSRTFRR